MAEEKRLSADDEHLAGRRPRPSATKLSKMRVTTEAASGCARTSAASLAIVKTIAWPSSCTMLRTGVFNVRTRWDYPDHLSA
jgi:hypothetical protein